ncbi:LmeA family phospholipid-binding protein [Parafrankia discariae]|uniref:LmeA family phospholipid-binding protein n=1 Tax=Parafrankia discariae TaxID=365528 RepID=UPI000368F97C|nr:DUF2993 domain-containing protein [Parafrankia discariae]
MNHGGDGTDQHAAEGDVPAHRSPWARPVSEEWPEPEPRSEPGAWPAPGGDRPTMDLYRHAGAVAAASPYAGQPGPAPGPPPPAGEFHPVPPVPPGPPVPPTTAYEPAPARRRRRRRLWALIAAVVGLVLLVVGDRAAVSVAEGQMAKQIEVSVAESLDCGSPVPTVRDVHIGGFPFLTQILLGKFKEIGVTIEGIPTPGPRISAVQARLSGIHVPLGDMISGSVGAVPVDDIRATVRLDYADLNTYLAGLPGGLQVNPVDGGRRVEISGRTDLWLFGSQEIGGVTTFEVRDNVLTLVPSEVTLRGAINATIPVPVGGLLPPIRIPVGQLPLDLDIVEASTGRAGLSLTATAHDVVLPAAEQPEPRQCPSRPGA